LFFGDLIHAVATGAREALPGSVVATLEARLDRLPDEARRVLRAAAVFGEVCWLEGVADLLGSGPRLAEVVRLLVDEELLVPAPASRLPGQTQLAFRHPLTREAAYGRLTERDRVLGHQLAAEWLERSGEQEPLVLAEHLDHAGARERAAPRYLAAAERALAIRDTAGGVRLANEAMACGLDAEGQVQALTALADACCWKMEWAAAAAYAEQAMPLASTGSWVWARSLLGIVAHAVYSGDRERFRLLAATIEAQEPGRDGPAPVIHILSVLAYFYDDLGQFADGTRVVMRMGELAAPAGEDPGVLAWARLTTAMRSAWVDGDPWTGRASGLAGQASFEAIRHHRFALLAQTYVGMNCRTLGLIEEAEHHLATTLRRDDAALGLAASHRSVYLVHTYLARGRVADARHEAERLASSGAEQGLPLHEGRGRLALAAVLDSEGDAVSAEREAAAALELLAPRSPMDAAAARGTLARLLSRAGRVDEGLALAREAARASDAFGGGFHDAMIRLDHAQALAAAGDLAAAAAVAAAACRRLAAQAERIPEQSVRRCFWNEVPEHAALRTLARLDPIH
jgi:eukaryotic-like serine/threonine-protein kinase